MKKTAILFFFAAFLSITALAQTVQEGINHLYAERYQSAKAVFEKLVAANPNNLEATYWLGQTYIASNDINAARALYQKALATNGNAPLIMVGMGHVNLLDGKTAEAKQLFESAITASKGRKGNDPNILDAIGRANVQAHTDKRPAGDLQYAIAKLNEAATLAPTNADIFLNLGNAYRKLHNGSEAVQAYRKAGNFAPALYRVGMLYMTQNNWDVVLENLNSAVAADQKFAPAYDQLYDYYLRVKRDFATAETFANKYKASTDPSVENDYMLAQTYYVQNKFNEAISTAKNIIAQAKTPRARVYRLLAYSALGNKDTASACNYSNEFLAKANDEELLGGDYILHATACARNNPEQVRADIMRAVKMDSVLSNQVNMLNEAVETARANNQKLLEGELRLMSYQLRVPKADKAELISYVAVPLYLGGAYQKADSVARVYSQLAPDSIHGYYWSALALSAIDTTMAQGLAVPAYEKVLAIAEKDPARLKSQGVNAARTLAIYYNNIKADRTAATSYLDRGLALDPTNPNLLAIQNAFKGTQRSQPSSSASTKTKVEPSKTKVKTKN
ncbi:MAG: tetratricopeptide repeat protein [Candidatus Dadabacteria bacterium]